MPLPTIDILISTMGDRISRVPNILLPSAEGIGYIVSFQTDGTHAIPEALLLRPDARILPLHGKGLCANRNNAISHSSADLMVLADDDVTLSLEHLQKLRMLAVQQPATDIFSLMALTFDGKPLHFYPPSPFTYPLIPKGFYFNSMGLVLRGRRQYPEFDTRFGLGSERLHMGEEDVFLHQCHKRGLTIAFYPQPLLATPAVTTSSCYASDPSLQQAKGAMLYLIHSPLSTLLRVISTAIKMRSQVPIISHVSNMLKGIRYIRKTNRQQ